jgi:isoamylase
MIDQVLIDTVWPGRAHPLGAAWDGHGVNFALFSAQATRVELCLFDRRGRERQRIELREQTDHVWHGYLPQARPGLVYGYRVHGPYQPHHGPRFNPNKLLIDPYAKDFVGRLRWNDALYGYAVGHKNGDLSFDRRDSAAYMPKCRVLETAFSWGDDRHPDVPWHEMVIYEMHLKGFRAGRGSALLHRRHRLRQHPQHRVSARAAAGDGLAALLGRGDAYRRLQLRPGLGAGA